MLLVNEAFAGAWALVWHWGAGAAIIILCLAAAYFSPLYKKYFLYTAGVTALCLFFFGTGIADQHARERAQQKVIIKYVDRIVVQARSKRALAQHDRWDRRDY